MPNAEASLPSARDRRLSFATLAIESTIASRSWRSLSFCSRMNGSSRFCCLLLFVARSSRAAFSAPKSFRAPFAFGDLPVAADLPPVFAAVFFAALVEDDFFAAGFDLAVVLELFFFAELAINLGHALGLPGASGGLLKS